MLKHSELKKEKNVREKSWGSGAKMERQIKMAEFENKT